MELSIIIPVYNTEKYLKECLDSVLSEIKEKDNVEVILIDDGSIDGSSSIYSSYSSENLIIIQNENHGVSYSRNIGIKKARGKWIFFLDSDDVLNKGWYQNVAEEFSRVEDILYFFCDEVEKGVSKTLLLDNIIGLNHYYRYLTFPGSRMFKRSFLTENKIAFHNKIINGEDLLFNLEALAKTNHYDIIKKSIYQYRYHFTSSTKKWNEKLFSSDRIFQKELERICFENRMKNKEKYTNFCLKNAIYTFILRLSFLEEKAYQEKTSIFNEDIYKKYLDTYQFKNKKSFVSYIVSLVKKGKYEKAITLVRIRNKKMILSFRKKKEFLEQV